MGRIPGLLTITLACLLASSSWALEACVHFPTGVQPSPDLQSYCQGSGTFMALDVHHLLRRVGQGPPNRVFEDVVLRKRFDASSPGLWELLRTQTTQEVTIYLYEIDQSQGIPALRATLILSAARVTALEPATPRESGITDDLERLRLQYDAITFRYKDGAEVMLSK